MEELVTVSNFGGGCVETNVTFNNFHHYHGGVVSDATMISVLFYTGARGLGFCQRSFSEVSTETSMRLHWLKSKPQVPVLYYNTVCLQCLAPETFSYYWQSHYTDTGLTSQALHLDREHTASKA